MTRLFDALPRPLHLEGRPLHTVGAFRIYTCGITPYDVTHLGHASTFLWADLAARVLRATGTKVSFTRNVTDVDETLLAEARRRGEPYDLLASRARFAFDTTMTRLGVRLPDAEPTARQTVLSVIELAAALLDQDAAYVVGSTVYARGAATASRAGLEQVEALALAAEYGDEPEDPARRHPLDVVVWRGAESEASWPSPWGPGRPGWHAQCAAMVLGAYGSGVDLHAGGADLRFPHHAAEALLAETATGVTPFARSWLRAGVVSVNGAKMAKSSGNLVLVDDLLADTSSAAVRLLCLDRSWAEPWSYDDAALERAAGLADQLYAAAGRAGSESGARAVEDALLAGLDVPAAVQIALGDGGPAARRLSELLVLG